MHKQGIMHRDLKPENIIYRAKTSNYVLADFGLTQDMKVQKYIYLKCGTFGYTAPEILNLQSIDERYNSNCDIYSLGIIFYCLLFKKLPYKGAQGS